MSKKILCSLILPALLIGAGWRVFHQYRALALFSADRGIEGARAAADRDPQGAEYHYRLGLLYSELRTVDRLDIALEELRKAVQLNPHDWRAQLDLAIVAERAGNLAEAERAYRQAVALNPHSALYHWRVANFYLRNGRLEESSREIERVLEIDGSYRSASILLLDRMGAPLSIIERHWPQDKRSRLDLLRALVKRRAEADYESDRLSIRTHWNNLLASSEKVSLKEAAFYINDLVRHGDIEGARAELMRVATCAGIEEPDFAAGVEAVWNGGFERPFSGISMDWQVGRVKDFAYRLSSGEGLRASQALRLQFPGQRNLDFGAIRQLVEVRQGADYQLSAWMKTRKVSSDQGLRLQIADPETGVVLAETECLTGSSDWTELRCATRVPSNRRLLAVQIRRKPSRRIYNLLGGTVWIDSVSLRMASNAPPIDDANRVSSQWSPRPQLGAPAALP